jgi:hypothetical protein
MPRSIWLFERTLWAALAMDLINNFAAWPMLAANLAMRGIVPNPVLMFISCSLSAAIGLLLWYFIARRRSVVAKWIFVVLIVLAVVAFIASFARPVAPQAQLMLAFAAVSEVLKVYAVTRLFTVEAKAWFVGKSA